MSMIGKTIYIFDVNRRRYTIPTEEERKRGKIYGELIWREQWRPLKVVGETRVSWLLEHGGKIPKRGARDVCFTEAEVDDACWAHQHGWRIARNVEREKNASILREIAALVGYKTDA